MIWGSLTNPVSGMVVCIAMQCTSLVVSEFAWHFKDHKDFDGEIQK
jgi:hypothetical protein